MFVKYLIFLSMNKIISRSVLVYCNFYIGHTAHITRNIHSSVLCAKKHYDPKFRKLRGKKVCKIQLPDFDEMRNEEKLTIEELRSKLKEKGIAPPRKWTEKPMFISCTGAVIDPYVPPEGDGKISLVTTPGVQQRYNLLQKKGKSYVALRKIRNYEYDFDVPTLAEKAQDIYIKVHNALNKKDEDMLHELVTEKCFPEIMDNVTNKTLRWKFIQSLEPARVVHIRYQELLTKENTFAQATVRFHTQQSLAIYDRFGRLMHGSEDTVKDVLEYVVFEKHLSNEYGEWRIHAKIIPDWIAPRDSILKTFRKPHMQPEIPQPNVEKSEDSKQNASKKTDSEQENLSAALT